MRLKAFAGPFGVCYQVVTRTTWQLVAVSDSHLKSTSSQIAAAAVAPSRATTRCPASLLASRRTYTALYHPDLYQRVSRYKREEHIRGLTPDTPGTSLRAPLSLLTRAPA